MIYTIEKRKAFGDGCMTSWYEVRSYTHRTAIGALVNGYTHAKFSTKKEAKEYCKKYGIETER